MNEKISQNTWILKEKELLEKLSLEISRDFSISEKLAKKLIYETHLSLEDLKEQVNNEKLNKLLSVLDWVRKIIEQASKNEIKELKKILENNNTLILWENSEIIKKLFSKKIIDKSKNPTSISENIMWASLWIANSVVVITDILYNLGLGIITTIPDIISILKWKAEIENLKKV